MPYQVLHILETAQPEGSSMARIVAALAQGLDPQRFRTRACFLSGDGPLAGMLRKVGAEVITLEWLRGARDPLGMWKFWRAIRAQKIDLVQIHFGGRSVRRLARTATGAKIVVNVHGRVLEPKGLALVNMSGRYADMVVAVSQAVAARVVDAPVRVIYTGAPIVPVVERSASRDPGSEFVLGTAGRLIALKGLEHLLGAASVLRREFPNLRVEIAGSGPARRDLEQAAKQLGIEGCVRFLGWVYDVNSVLPQWDVFVMPSLEEGFPVAGLDAMAAGLPVVASAVGGVPELIEDGKSGWLVPPRDEQALAARVRLLLCDPEQRLKMGSAARERVRDHFSLRQMTESFGTLYDQLLLS